MLSILANQDVILNYGDKVMESRRDIEQALLDALERGFVTCVINKYEDSGSTDTMLSDAYAFLAQLSEKDDAIVVIENATCVPEGDLNIFDAKSYVENILICY